MIANNTNNIPDTEKEALLARISGLEQILDTINDGFFTLDTYMNFTYANKAFEHICNCKREDLVGNNYWDQFPVEKNRKFYHEYTNAMEKQTYVEFEEYIASLDKWVAVSIHPSTKGLSVYVTDTTLQKKALQLLEAQDKRLKEITWLQSHKVRGPLVSILGLAALLNETHSQEDYNKTILGINTACKELDKVIKEIHEQAKTTIFMPRQDPRTA